MFFSVIIYETISNIKLTEAHIIGGMTSWLNIWTSNSNFNIITSNHRAFEY